MSRFLFMFICIFSLSCANGQLSINPLFQDHAVVQRNVDLPIKGIAAPRANIQVDFADEHRVVTADEDGNWKAVFPAMPAGGPYNIKVDDDNEQIVITDVYVGDVWLLSGQSNMEWRVSQSDRAKKTIANAGDDLLRHFKVPLTGGTELLEVVSGGSWKVDNPENTGDFSAVGYYFAQQIRKEYPDIPIGLLNSSWGGSRVEPWMRAEILGYESNETASAEIEADHAEQRELILEKLRPVVGDITKVDAGMKDGKPFWAAENYDISSWREMEVPQLWEEASLPDFDGVVWYAYDVYLPSGSENQKGSISLARIDDSDDVFINGKRVGGMRNAYSKDRVYNVEKGIFKTGENRIVVRIEDTGGGGGFYGGDNTMLLKVGGLNMSLAGSWKYKPAAMYSSGSIPINQTPTLLFNHMIHPLLDFPIKGALWYQGESNAGNEDALEYEDLFAEMISDWRSLWGIDFPFLTVQLANFMAADESPSDGGWPRIREAHANISKRLSLAGDAVIIDIGEANDIHPRNKHDVGYRLSLLARKIAYGEDDIDWNSPRFVSKEIRNNTLVLQFDHVAGGLHTDDKYGYVHGFAVAGEDQHWHWAQGAITGPDEIIVYSPKVSKPVHARYAWGNNPDDVDVYNAAGLPLSPFRTDEWDYPLTRYLALGDSYTVGTSVKQNESFPYQLADHLTKGAGAVDVDVIAVNGWTTTDLLDSLSVVKPEEEYDIVTLLIGVNNQYQGKPFSLYEKEFDQLLDQAIQYAGGHPDRVVVVSIPDYAYTPFGQTKANPEKISEELRRYNAYADKMARERGAHYVYITDITKEGLEKPSLVAKDKLHPSGEAYTRFANRIKKLALR